MVKRTKTLPSYYNNFLFTVFIKVWNFINSVASETRISHFLLSLPYRFITFCYYSIGDFIIISTRRKLIKQVTLFSLHIFPWQSFFPLDPGDKVVFLLFSKMNQIEMKNMKINGCNSCKFLWCKVPKYHNLLYQAVWMENAGVRIHTVNTIAYYNCILSMTCNLFYLYKKRY